MELDYDESLRVIKESYYDDNGSLIDETEYDYDGDGNRLEVSHGDAEGTYYYDNIHQLTEIMTETGSEIYTYDQGGRIKSITRDGETWNLEYNSADLITKITNSNGEVLIEYEYDSNGRRIEAIDNEGERNYLVANKIQNILNTSVRLGNSFLNILDKVDTTFSVIDAVWTVFKLGSNPSAILPTTLNSINLLDLPSLEDATITLRANAGRIVSTVLTKKVPNEINNFQSYFNSQDSKFAFFPPDIISKLLPGSVPTGLKIQNRSLIISNNKENNRLFGVGMTRPKKGQGNQVAKLQFFRMDYGAYQHIGGQDRKNWDTWPDNNFHFHIPKN